MGEKGEREERAVTPRGCDGRRERIISARPEKGENKDEKNCFIFFVCYFFGGKYNILQNELGSQKSDGHLT